MQKKSFDKIHHPFLIKSLSKLGMEGSSLILIKSIYENPTGNIILNSERLNAFFPEIPSYHFYSTWFWWFLKNKGHWDWKGKSKTVSVNRLYDYIEILMESIIGKLLELISEFCKVAKIQDQYIKLHCISVC